VLPELASNANRRERYTYANSLLELRQFRSWAEGSTTDWVSWRFVALLSRCCIASTCSASARMGPGLAFVRTIRVQPQISVQIRHQRTHVALAKMNIRE